MKRMNPQPAAGAIGQQGARLYEERLRPFLEPVHNGKYVAIDVDTGDYEIGEDLLAASDRAAEKRPGARLYVARIGARTLGRVGGRLTTTQP
jgi:hypothetical protein